VGLFSKLLRRGASDAPALGLDLLRERDPKPLLRVCRQLLAAGRCDRALTLLRAGVLRFPEDPEVGALQREAERVSALPQLDRAREALAKEPCSANHARLSQILRRLGDEESAIEQGRSAIACDARAPFGYRAIGRVHLDRFRAADNTIDGMNALRYYSKACSLQPNQAATLLALAEIFVLLEAPEAARRFLAPITKTMPGDPRVEMLERRCVSLPPEATSNVEDLFLLHERRRRGPLHEAAHESDVCPTAVGAAQVDELMDGIEGTREVRLLDRERRELCGRGPSPRTEEELDALGLLAESVRSCSSRMGIGTFERLALRGDECLVVLEALPRESTICYFGSRPSRQDEVEQAFERVRSGLTATSEVTG
jgi:Flp pilus assembly protein TadD